MEDDANSYITDRVDRDIVAAMRKFVCHLEINHQIKAEKVNFFSKIINDYSHLFQSENTSLSLATVEIMALIR